jgi:hypothetical protein
VAEMAEAAQERVDHGPVAEKVVPLVVA